MLAAAAVVVAVHELVEQPLLLSMLLSVLRLLLLLIQVRLPQLMLFNFVDGDAVAVAAAAAVYVDSAPVLRRSHAPHPIYLVADVMICR